MPNDNFPMAARRSQACCPDPPRMLSRGDIIRGHICSYCMRNPASRRGIQRWASHLADAFNDRVSSFRSSGYGS